MLDSAVYSPLMPAGKNTKLHDERHNYQSIILLADFYRKKCLDAPFKMSCRSQKISSEATITVEGAEWCATPFSDFKKMCFIDW